MNNKKVYDYDQYVYLKVLFEVSSKFKVGDYVKLYQTEFYNEDDELLTIPNFTPQMETVRRFECRREGNSVCVYVPKIYKLTIVDGLYIEAELVGCNFKEHKLTITPNIYDKMCVNEFLSDSVQSFLGDSSGDQDIQQAVEMLSNKLIQLDEDYTESLIMDTPYVPYASCVEKFKHDYADAMKKIKAINKIRASEAAVRGWETRRYNIARKKIIEANAKKAEARRLNKTKKKSKR